MIGPLITGLQKTDKLLVEPYFSYFNRFLHLVATTPRLLVIGYGFGDSHINAILSRFTRWHGSARRVVAIDFFQEWSISSAWGPERQEFREIITRWAGELSAMNVHECPDPWRPSGAGAGYLQVYCRGFQDAVERHGNNIIQFFRETPNT